MLSTYQVQVECTDIQPFCDATFPASPPIRPLSMRRLFRHLAGHGPRTKTIFPNPLLSTLAERQRSIQTDYDHVARWECRWGKGELLSVIYIQS